MGPGSALAVARRKRAMGSLGRDNKQMFWPLCRHRPFRSSKDNSYKTGRKAMNRRNAVLTALLTSTVLFLAGSTFGRRGDGGAADQCRQGAAQLADEPSHL